MRVAYSSLYRASSLLASGSFFLVAIALIGWQAVRGLYFKWVELTERSQSYLFRPGPKYYYNHYSGLQFACVLAFDALQALRIIERPCVQGTGNLRTRLLRALTTIYWSVLGLSAFACTICYGLTRKPDATAIQALIFINSLVVFTRIYVAPRSSKEQRTLERIPSGANRYARLSACSLAFVNGLNRVLEFVRFVLSVLFFAGAIQLAMQYHYQNP